MQWKIFEKMFHEERNALREQSFLNFFALLGCAVILGKGTAPKKEAASAHLAPAPRLPRQFHASSDAEIACSSYLPAAEPAIR